MTLVNRRQSIDDTIVQLRISEAFCSDCLYRPYSTGMLTTGILRRRKMKILFINLLAAEKAA